MREIKFRAWNRGTMDYGLRDVTIWNGHVVPEGDMILMQYTGLLDKNGTEIYEGDIVQGEDVRADTKIYFTVSWLRCGWVLQRPKNVYYELDCDENIEVIGNIHSSPELFK
jgi:uncharacterized phage protein (TIGR01671 family)